MPFTAATAEKIWWLATIDNRTWEVEASHELRRPVWEIEDKFANSVARVAVDFKIPGAPVSRDTEMTRDPYR